MLGNFIIFVGLVVMCAGCAILKLSGVEEGIYFACYGCLIGMAEATLLNIVGND